MSHILTSRDMTKKAVEVVGGEEDTPYPMAPKVSSIKMTFSLRMFGTLKLIPNFVGALTPGASTSARGCHIRGPKLGGGGSPRRKPRDWDEDGSSGSRPPACACHRTGFPCSRSFHHALAGLLVSGVFPARRCADPGSPRGALHRRRLRVGTGLLRSGARRGRGQGFRRQRPGGAVTVSVQCR